MMNPVIELDVPIRQLLEREGYTDIEIERVGLTDIVYLAYIDSDVLVTVCKYQDHLEVYDQYMEDKHKTLVTTITLNDLLNPKK